MSKITIKFEKKYLANNEHHIITKYDISQFLVSHII